MQGGLDFEFGKVRLGTSASTGPLGPTGGVKKRGPKKETTGSLLKKVRWVDGGRKSTARNYWRVLQGTVESATE